MSLGVMYGVLGGCPPLCALCTSPPAGAGSPSVNPFTRMPGAWPTHMAGERGAAMFTAVRSAAAASAAASAACPALRASDV